MKNWMLLGDHPPACSTASELEARSDPTFPGQNTNSQILDPKNAWAKMATEMKTIKRSVVDLEGEEFKS